mmetsp:Transcript_82424/g.163535  ORF Transcript_82424/g.163535 Transcript_82424/m.163535 type:complete len:103 (-) Transcript_82424:732-1040(-)|eukprot:CAMPEP_0172720464 /NCGR_PEP_ID=MMETSP1074-20121228/76966_1 /TAXON_ID=2916 /ORGANISM="Ceratium fusus, Strain PA161109" /LENGTH=102 /DNA_ID=CAMNT_0013545987 /DNA_START=58 /DNA_END=366 /DNA_ORIENTATION=+
MHRPRSLVLFWCRMHCGLRAIALQCRVDNRLQSAPERAPEAAAAPETETETDAPECSAAPERSAAPALDAAPALEAAAAAPDDSASQPAASQSAVLQARGRL